MDWVLRAACGTKPPEWFFPPPQAGGRGGSSVSYEKARQVCNHCPVRTDCLAEALKWEDTLHRGRTGEYSRHGMWGGLTPDERSELVKVKRFTRQIV